MGEGIRKDPYNFLKKRKDPYIYIEPFLLKDMKEKP